MKIELLTGDCFDLIKNQPDNSVDLVITSPPYSDIINYGKNVSTKKPDEYVDWILPLFREIHRVLKPSGSFILNINDKTEDGYRSTYIYELISRNSKETKLKLYDTYFWHKKNGLPNGGKRRFRNTTEFIFHFCKDTKHMKFYMDRVMEEPKASSNERYKYSIDEPQGQVIDGKRVKTRTLYPQRKMIEGVSTYTYVEKDIPTKVRPDNVFRFSTAAAARDNLIKHPAPFHKELPLYFINLLTDIDDVVLDPFSGIATTGMACKELDRRYIGYELNESYTEYAINRIYSENLTTYDYKIQKIDLDGNLITEYNSIGDAVKDNPGTSYHNIMSSFRNGGRKTSHGFIWQKITIKNP